MGAKDRPGPFDRRANDDGWVLLPLEITPAIACAIKGAPPPPWPNDDPHGAIQQFVEDHRKTWAAIVALGKPAP